MLQVHGIATELQVVLQGTSGDYFRGYVNATAQECRHFERISKWLLKRGCLILQGAEQKGGRGAADGDVTTA